MAKKNGGRHRSPAYPSIDLESAIERAQSIYQHEARNQAHVDVVVSHWGYSPGSANGMRAIAALKQFGLLHDEGKNENRQVKLTKRALDILMPETEGDEHYRKAIMDAALEPPIHAEIWEKYAGQLPSDAALKRYLLLERDFNDSSVDGLIRQFRRTLSYAQSFGEDTIRGSDEPEVWDEFDSPPPKLRVGDYVQRTFPPLFPQPAKITHISDDGKWAFVEGQQKGVEMSILKKPDPKPKPFFEMPPPPDNPDYAPPETCKPVTVLIGYDDGKAIYATVSFDVPLRKGFLKRLAKQLESLESGASGDEN